MTDLSEDDRLAYACAEAMRASACEMGRDPLVLAALVMIRLDRPMVEKWVDSRPAGLLDEPSGNPG